MAVLSFVQRFIERNCPFVHARRAQALVGVVGSLMGGAKLNLSALGRGLDGDSRTKHKIKRVDRLLGNAHLCDEREALYRALSKWILSGRTRPVIAIDWSDLETGNRYQMLKAAVCVEGRALTLYEEVHGVAGISRSRAERVFLKRLAQTLPADCHPIIVTDAGFHGPWFRQVRALGWDYVGRLRNRLRVGLAGTDDWCLIKELHAKASAKPVSLGMAEVAHRSPYRAHLCLVRGYQPRRGRRKGNRSKSVKWREPWLLATSLEPDTITAAQVVSLYAKRMQIEETFRDMKDRRWSFALVYARSRTIARREVLLLIATLALFALWLVGIAARALDWHRHFQANTEKHRPVLSVIFLGREVHRDPRYRLTEDIIALAADVLRLSIVELHTCR